MFIMQVLASQLPFLANRNAELAVFKPVNCIKIGGHVAMLHSSPTILFIFYSMLLPRVAFFLDCFSHVILNVLLSELFHSMWEELASTFEDFLFATRFVRDCASVIGQIFSKVLNLNCFSNFPSILATLPTLKR
jgi:hypothetical protein